MIFARCKELLSCVLGVPISTIHITPEGEIKLSYKDRVPVVDEKNAELFKVIQVNLYEELASFREMEALKAENAQLQKALDVRGQMFNEVGLELRSPLSAVLNLSEILSERSLPGRADKLVSTIYRSSQHVSRLVEDALNLNALDRGEMKVNFENLQLRQFISSLESEFTPVAAQRDVKLRFQIDEELPDNIITDPDKLNQVAGSLIYFGILKPGEAATIGVSFSWLNDGLLISVSAPDLQLTMAETEALLDPWPGHGQQESGLSMTVANGMVKLMGGQLKVSDYTKPGCVLRVWVPAEASESKKVVARISKTKTILAADDDPTSLFVLEQVVEQLGYTVRAADSGTSALRMLAEEEFSLLMLDLYMPGMDGFEVAESVRDEIDKDLPVIAMSSDTTDLARARAAEAGMVEFLTKPLRRERLSQVLNRVLGP